MIDTFKILVVGAFSAGKTTFIRTLSEIDVVSTDLRFAKPDAADELTVALDFGRLTLAEDLVLYFFANPGARRLDTAIAYMTDKGFFTPEVSFIAVIDSAAPHMDQESAFVLQFVQSQTRPMVILLSKQDQPNARTVSQMREAIGIPSAVPVLTYTPHDTASAKRVVLTLIETMPQAGLVPRVIAGLRAQIDGPPKV